MIYYTSDLHLGHGNIIRHCNRPFESAEAMDKALIANWNSRVTPLDTVYIVGDLFFPSKYDHEAVLKKLKGKKYLIIGNHDKNWMKKVDLSKYFISVQNILNITDAEHTITLSHRPIMDFNGDYLIYGHIHNNKNDDAWPALKTMPNAMNAGVEVNGYMPVTFDELVRNNGIFRMD